MRRGALGAPGDAGGMGGHWGYREAPGGSGWVCQTGRSSGHGPAPGRNKRGTAAARGSGDGAGGARRGRGEKRRIRHRSCCSPGAPAGETPGRRVGRAGAAAPQGTRLSIPRGQDSAPRGTAARGTAPCGTGHSASGRGLSFPRAERAQHSLGQYPRERVQHLRDRAQCFRGQRTAPLGTGGTGDTTPGDRAQHLRNGAVPWGTGGQRLVPHASLLQVKLLSAS